MKKKTPIIILLTIMLILICTACGKANETDKTLQLYYELVTLPPLSDDGHIDLIPGKSYKIHGNTADGEIFDYEYVPRTETR